MASEALNPGIDLPVRVILCQQFAASGVPPAVAQLAAGGGIALEESAASRRRLRAPS